MEAVDPKDTTEPTTEPIAKNTVPDELLENAVDVSTNQDGGVRKVILREGTDDEKPNAGDEVVVHYTGTLLDGTKFDSSRDRNDKFKFKLGQGQVIKAWDQGVASMRRGELCRLICLPDYAYGASGSPPTIPPNSTLIFEVELFDWKGEDLSEGATGGIIRSVVTAGSGYLMPNESSQVQVDVKGLHEGRVFDERSVSFTVGDASEQQLPYGIDVAIQKFKKGEKSVLTLKPEYAFGSQGCEDYNIPGGATVKYEVTLTDFERGKETWELDLPEKLSQSELTKAKGTTLFKAGKYDQAIKKYKRLLKLLEEDADYTDDQAEQRNSLRLAAHLNCALCYLKQQNWAEAKESCHAAMELDQRNEKALFRRGQAYVGLKDWPEAKRDFQAVLELDPNNKSAKNQLIVCEQKLKLERERERKLYASMVSKGFSAPPAPKETKEMSNGDSSAV